VTQKAAQSAAFMVPRRQSRADTRIFKYFSGSRKCSEGQVVAAAQGRGVMLLVIAPTTRGLRQAGAPSRRRVPRHR
jgi:hypothetical protein